MKKLRRNKKRRRIVQHSDNSEAIGTVLGRAQRPPHTGPPAVYCAEHCEEARRDGVWDLAYDLPGGGVMYDKGKQENPGPLDRSKRISAQTITKEQAFYLAGRDLVRDHYKCVLGRPEGCPSLTVSEPPCSDGKGRYNFICVGGGQRYHIRIALAGDLAVRLAKARKESTDPVVSLVAALRDMSLALAYPFEDFSWFDDGHDLRDDYREALRQAQVAPKVYQHDRHLMACGQVSLAIVELAHHLTEAWTELERRVNSILADGINVTKIIGTPPDRGGHKE